MIEEIVKTCLEALLVGFLKLVLPRRLYERFLASCYPADAAELKAKRERRGRRRRARR